MSGSWGISPSRIRSLILASSRLMCFSTCYGGQKKHMVGEGSDVNKEKDEVNSDIGVKPGVRLIG